MHLFTRRVPAGSLPGPVLKVHSHRDLEVVLSRDLAGSLVVIDQRDLDAPTARRLLAAGPKAILNAAEFVSGRFANLGPEILAEGGVALFQAERGGALALADGGRVRLFEDTLYDGPVVLLDLDPFPLERVRAAMDAARSGLVVQLETFAHTTSEFLRREEDLLLHGQGMPTLTARIQDRSVVVIGPDVREGDVTSLRRYVRRHKPLVIAVDAGAESSVARQLRPDVLILSGAGTVQPKTLARCREVVLTGSGHTVRRRAEEANVPVHDVPTSLTGLDLGMLLAYRGGARLVVRAGGPDTLDEFIDSGRSTQASNVLTRLRLGSTVVDAAAVPALYSGMVRRWHLVAVVLLAMGAMGAVAAGAVFTPWGQDWWDQIRDLSVWSR